MTTSNSTSNVTTTTSSVSKIRDISIKDIFSKNIGDTVNLIGKRIYNIPALPEFGGKLKNGNGLVFMVSDYSQNMKKALKVIKHPYKNSKTVWIPTAMFDNIVVVRQVSHHGIFSILFEYAILEINDMDDNSNIKAIIREKGRNTFLPTSIKTSLKNAIFKKLKSDITIPFYAKCFRSLFACDWEGFSYVDDKKPKEDFDEIKMLEDIIYTKKPCIYVIHYTIDNDNDELHIEWRLHEGDKKKIQRHIKTFSATIPIDDHKHPYELFMFSSGKKLVDIVKRYGHLANVNGNEFYMISALR